MIKQTKTVEHANFIYFAIYSFSSKHEFKLKFQHFHTSRWTRPTICQRSRDIYAYQYRIYGLDFCSYNFHIFRFSRSGKGEVDVYRFMSKHSLDHHALFCHDPLLHFAIDASSCMKLWMNHRIKCVTINRMCRSFTIFQIPQL